MHRGKEAKSEQNMAKDVQEKMSHIDNNQKLAITAVKALICDI